MRWNRTFVSLRLEGILGRPYFLAMLALLASLCGQPVASLAVDAAKPADKKAAPSKAALPAAEDLQLTTGDDLRLAVTYYPGTRGKETIPVVLLHMWKQTHSDYKDLALYLQGQGHAVIVPDLRGHGSSTHFKQAADRSDLNAATMPSAEFINMVAQDMVAVKDFLWEKNNAGALNIDKLCVVGAELGALVALNFAAFDAAGYNAAEPLPTYGPLQLGNFVKALVLLSPDWSFHGLSIKQAAYVPRVQKDISLLVVVGKKDSKALSEAKRVVNIFEKSHLVHDDSPEKKTLFMARIDTSLQGTKMLDPKLDVQKIIGEFIERRLLKPEEARDWIWKERKYPHE